MLSEDFQLIITDHLAMRRIALKTAHGVTQQWQEF